MVYLQVPFPTLLLWVRSPSQQQFSWGLGGPAQFLSSLRGGGRVPANLWNDSSKPITRSCGTRGPLATFLIPQSPPPTAFGGSLF